MSPRAAWQLESFGFEQVYDYVAGKNDWISNGLPVEGDYPDEFLERYPETRGIVRPASESAAAAAAEEEAVPAPAKKSPRARRSPSLF